MSPARMMRSLQCCIYVACRPRNPADTVARVRHSKRVDAKTASIKGIISHEPLSQLFYPSSRFLLLHVHV